MVGELEGILSALEELIGKPQGLGAERLNVVRTALDEARRWIDGQEAEMQAEYLFMSPGDPDDDFEYRYNIALKRVLDQSRHTISALEAERDAITAEQDLWQAGS
jgi:hypothetical protein